LSNSSASQEACAMLGLSTESLLSVSVNAGCIALPALLNIKQVTTFEQAQEQYVSLQTGALSIY
jgi:hypothetical protein